MKATTKTPNTLFLAIWKESQKCIVLGNFRTETGMEPEIEGMGPVMADKGDDPFALLAKTLHDIECLCARHVVVFTNDPALADMYTFPIHLEPTSEKRMHLYNPTHWDILRGFFLYESWSMLKADKLPKAKELWRETYGKRSN